MLLWRFIGSGIEPNDGANVWLTEGGLHNFNQAPQPGQAPIQGRNCRLGNKRLLISYPRGRSLMKLNAKRFTMTKRLAQEYLPYIHPTPLSMAAIRDRIQGVTHSFRGAFLPTN